MKKVLMATIILAGTTGSVMADPQTVINNIASVPGKLHNHIQMEIEKTKKYQANSWAKMKEDFLKIKAKFIKQ
tara:strand:+ start:417 stop:635 length:219 start_codon:yes stop_codon:yes gene_type:complete